VAGHTREVLAQQTCTCLLAVNKRTVEFEVLLESFFPILPIPLPSPGVSRGGFFSAWSPEGEGTKRPDFHGAIAQG